MSSPLKIDAWRRLSAMFALVATLGGCSDIYFDRRDSIVPVAGDAVAASKVTQMVDPWPQSSANRDIAYDGEKMQSAVERYRTNRIIQPVNATTSSVAYQQAAQAAASAATSQNSSTSSSQQSPVSGWASPSPSTSSSASKQP
ncbi:MAG: hypothetical protein HY659_13630 [Rhizobiales bacterium]|nr:hypothetical protein [Hyphomicrobiales bacterium]